MSAKPTLARIDEMQRLTMAAEGKKRFDIAAYASQRTSEITAEAFQPTEADIQGHGSDMWDEVSPAKVERNVLIKKSEQQAQIAYHLLQLSTFLLGIGIGILWGGSL